MKVAAWLLAVAAAFALGRWGVPEPEAHAPDSAAGPTADSLEQALYERDPLERSFALSAPLRGIGPGDIPALKEFVTTQQHQLSREDARLVMMAWSRLDAPGAFRWSLDQPGKWGETLSIESLYAWGFRDGSAAVEALQDLGDLDDLDLQQRLTAASLDGWIASGEYMGVSAAIAAIDDPRVRRKRAFLLAGEIAKEGPEALVAWAEEVPEDAPNEFKTQAFYHASGMVARRDPQLAAGTIETHGGQPYVKGSLAHIARKWARHHPPADLFAWLETLPAGEERDEAVGDAFRVWHGKSAKPAEQWLEAAMPAAYLDAAIAELVRASAQEVPQAAVVWAERIQDPKQRHRSMSLAGRQFWRRSPQAAAIWLEEADLPEPAKNSIRGGPQRGHQRMMPPSAREEFTTGSG
ncbi:MAG: hypothetical protein AAEJ53_12275 [Myxococcota bacterium]